MPDVARKFNLHLILLEKKKKKCQQQRLMFYVVSKPVGRVPNWWFKSVESVRKCEPLAGGKPRRIVRRDYALCLFGNQALRSSFFLNPQDAAQIKDDSDSSEVKPHRQNGGPNS